MTRFLFPVVFVCSNSIDFAVHFAYVADSLPFPSDMSSATPSSSSSSASSASSSSSASSASSCSSAPATAASSPAAEPPKWDWHEALPPFSLTGGWPSVTFGKELRLKIAAENEFKDNVLVFTLYIRSTKEDMERAVPYAVEGELAIRGVCQTTSKTFVNRFPFINTVCTRGLDWQRVCLPLDLGDLTLWPFSGKMTVTASTRLRQSLAPVVKLSTLELMQMHVPFDFTLAAHAGSGSPSVRLHRCVAEAMCAPLRARATSLFSDSKSDVFHLGFGTQESLEFLVGCFYRGIDGVAPPPFDVLVEAYAAASFMCSGLLVDNMEKRIASGIGFKGVSLDDAVTVRRSFPNAVEIRDALDLRIRRGEAAEYARIMEARVSKAEKATGEKKRDSDTRPLHAPEDIVASEPASKKPKL